MQALQFWNEQRAYPAKQIDDKRFYSAFTNQRFEQYSEGQMTGSATEWRAIGPHNIGGRTLAVALNPQNTKTIYAGSASGGLWRSFTAGKGSLAWHHVNTGFPVLSVSSIAIAPNDSNTIMIGTGEVYNQFSSIGGLSIRTTRGSYGIGILMTTDGGKTWKKTLDWSYGELRGVQSVKFHPLSIKHAWAATSIGIFKSSDTGKTWMNVSDIPMGTDLVFDALDTNVVIAAHGNLGSDGGGIYRTLNGGTSWDQLTQGLPPLYGGKVIFSQYQSSPNVIFASIGNGAVSGTWLCKTTDYGNSWNIISTLDYSSYQGWYSHFVAVDPGDSSNVICGGIDLWKSTNGGVTLVRKSNWAAWYFGTPLPGDPEGPPNYAHADHHAAVYDPIDYHTIYFGTDGGVFCSTDGGLTFEGRNGGYQTTQFYNGFSSARLDSNLAIGGMQDNATAIYEGTVAWRRVIGGDGCMTAMSPTSLDTMYGTYQNLSLLRSTDKGGSFLNIPVPSSSVTNFVGPYSLSESHPKILYAGRDRIFKTTNGGDNWTATNNNQSLDGNPALAVAVSPTSPDTVYVTMTPRISSAKMFRTTDGGSTWTDVTGVLPNRYMIDIAVHPDHAAVLYVAVSGFGTSHLFKSTNAGTSWIDVGAGLPDVPTSAVAINPFNPDHVYIGNDLGVYLSTKGGSEWLPYSQGLYEATLVMDLSISRMNKAIRAVTHGHGVFERPLFDLSVSVHRQDRIAGTFRLEQNYPNPFNPTTTFEFSIPSTGNVTLKLYNSIGQEMMTLFDGEAASDKMHRVTLNGENLSAGSYFARLTFGEKVLVRKVALLK